MKKLKFLVAGILGLCISGSTFAQSAAQKIDYSKGNVYTGIEVGSKGVKMSILEKVKSGKQVGNYRIIKDTSINTDFISFTPQSFQNTVKALTALYGVAAKNYSIPTENIFTVVSSGVKGQALRLNKNEDVSLLIDSFKTKIKEPKRKVEVVDVLDEARLSHIGIVPAERRYTTFLIDIGSGNTKGGYFPNGDLKTFKLFDVNWGTRSINNETEKRSAGDAAIPNFTKNLKRVMQGAVNDDMIYAVNASNAFAMNDYVAISGGISWSVATLLYPELYNQPVVPVTYEDVEYFITKIEQKNNAYQAAAISKLIPDNDPNKTTILNEVNRVHSVFDQKSLLSGANLMLKIMRQFSGVREKKQFYLIKNGQVGWVSAYVDMK
jgi:hypothetical protein